MAVGNIVIGRRGLGKLLGNIIALAGGSASVVDTQYTVKETPLQSFLQQLIQENTLLAGHKQPATNAKAFIKPHP